MAGVFEILSLSDFLTEVSPSESSVLHTKLISALECSSGPVPASIVCSKDVSSDCILTRPSVMSPTGKLVAYSHPYLIKDVKAEAAIVAMAWKRHSASVDTSTRSPLQSLSIETSEYNITARSIQSDLLLVLVGFRASGPDEEFKIASEKTFDDMDDGYDASHLEEDMISLTSSGYKSSRVEALMLQKRKLDKLAETIGEEASVFNVAD